MRPIAHIENGYITKFGVPRQSNLVNSVISYIVFEPEYRDANALRGIDQFSHLWLIWEFSKAKQGGFSPTVRPPRLGGNERIGVFATRSPFRPNSLGLSCVRLLQVKEMGEKGTVLVVSGADLMNQTPIYDIKPYLAYADSFPQATGGFTEQRERKLLDVCGAEEIKQKAISVLKMKQDEWDAICEVLAQDPRPAYQKDPERIYGMRFADYEIKFQVLESVVHIVGIDTAITSEL